MRNGRLPLSTGQNINAKTVTTPAHILAAPGLTRLRLDGARSDSASYGPAVAIARGRCDARAIGGQQHVADPLPQRRRRDLTTQSATHVTFYTSGQGVGAVPQQIEAMQQFHNAMR